MLVKDNAYLILWLQSDADDWLINKRYHELEKIAKVWLNKKYQNDLSFINYKKLRSESSIKNAFHNLTDQNNKIYNFFFWFNLSDEKNLEIFNLYKSGQVEESLKKWESEYNKTNDLNYLMNYVVWWLLVLEIDDKSNIQSMFVELALNIPKYIKIIFDSNYFFNNIITIKRVP